MQSSGGCKTIMSCKLDVHSVQQFKFDEFMPLVWVYRIGCLKGGVQELKSHAWFSTLDWTNVMLKKDIPPIRPKVAVLYLCFIYCLGLSFNALFCFVAKVDPSQVELENSFLMDYAYVSSTFVGI